MKMPKRPPELHTFLSQTKNVERLETIFRTDVNLAIKGKYPHWDRLLFHQPPGDLSHEEWWFVLKMKRQALYKEIPLNDRKGSPFKYAIVDSISEKLHEIDQGAGGFIRMPEQIINPETKDEYYVNSLIEEAITSSQLEGAATTRQVAKDMIKRGRPPRDRSEQMILNNYQTMGRIDKLKDESLSPRLVFDIHEIITKATFDDESGKGRFRRPDEHIIVGDMYNEIFHDPPPAEELEHRMAAMCDFANSKSPVGFVHPVIRSIILHFWPAYDHSFVDGNGRVARALFYWSMLRHGYWLFEFVSISQIIRKAPAKYGRSFLYTETDENDLTYFIFYQLEVIQRAINELHEYIKRRTERLRAIESELRGMAALNHRQRALIGHALRHPHQRYTIRSHQTSHNVAYQTARTDLLDLENRGLVTSRKIGKTWHFTPISDLKQRLAELE